MRALRAALIEAIAAHLERHLNEGATQAGLAAPLGLSRPRISRLLKRDVALFGLDSLAAIAARVGLTVRLTVARPHVSMGVTKAAVDALAAAGDASPAALVAF